MSGHLNRKKIGSANDPTPDAVIMRTLIATVIAVLTALTLIQTIPKTEAPTISSEPVAAASEVVANEIKKPAPQSKNTDTKQAIKKEQPAQPAVTPKPSSAPVSACDAIAKYDWDVALMTAIAMGESGCRADAKGDTSLTYVQNGRTYGYSIGIFQVRILPGREHCDTFDVNINVKCAYDIYKSQGLNAWTVYSTGAYLKFL